MMAGCQYVRENENIPSEALPITKFSENTSVPRIADAITASPSIPGIENPNTPNLTVKEEPQAKKKKTLVASSLKDQSISVEPTEDSTVDRPDWGEDQSDVKMTDNAQQPSTNVEGVGNDTTLAPISNSKAEIIQQVMENISNMEVFYPDLDDTIMTSEEMTLEEWLSGSTAERIAWRDYYDPKRNARKNGFIRENADSIINDVLMKAIFGQAKLLGTVRILRRNFLSGKTL